MDAKLIEKIVYRLAGEHIADKERTLLELIALVLKKSDNATGL